MSYTLKRMLWNSLIEARFDFAYCACYPNLMSLKHKLQTAQSACISFCLKTQRKRHIRLNRFEKNNWLPIKKWVDQCIAVMAYSFKKNLSCIYVDKSNLSPV